MFHPYPNDRMKAILRAQGYISSNPLFLDMETTGLSDMDEICEIAIVDLTGQPLINSLVKPTKRIPPSMAEIHGITDELVQSAPAFVDLLPRLEQILRGREVLVYNAEFDMAKIARSANANGCWFEGGEPWFAAFATGELTPDGISIYDHHWHCAMELYAAYYGDWNDYHGSYRWQRLSTALRQCGIDLPKDIHRAHADAEMTRRLVLHMAQSQLTLPTNHTEEGDSNEQS